MKYNSPFPKINVIVAVVFLAIQIVSILYQYGSKSKHFFWSPHNTQTHFQLSGTVRHSQMTNDDLMDRYHLSHAEGWEVHSIVNIQTLITLFENQHLEDSATVIMKYSINGGEIEIWHSQN